jgi:dihydroceramidase
MSPPSPTKPKQVRGSGLMLSPRMVLVTLVGVCALAVSIYLSAVETTLQDEKEHHNKPGVYGPITADFDWCERNHHWSPYVAEPYNTFTSLVYCVIAIFFYMMHRKHMEKRIVLLCFVLFLIGAGSTLFHGTLVYGMQLMDELPMLYLILTAGWALLERDDLTGSAAGQKRAGGILVLSVFCTAMLALTPQHSTAHIVGRLITVFSFATSMVYVFYGASVAVGAHGLALGSDVLERDGNGMGEMFALSFLSIIVALVSWIIDNVACDVLYALPVYPQLHALGWHLGTAVTCYCMFLALHMQRLTLHKYHYQLEYIAGMPVLRNVKLA